MQFSQALNPRRIARSLVTVLALALIQTVGSPIIAPKLTAPASHAVTGSITAAGSTTRSFITIPAGVESITLTITGGGGGQGGTDGKAGGKGGLAQRIVASFAVTPGDVVALLPGNAGTNGINDANKDTGGTGNGGAVAGGASTVTDSFWNVNGTSYQNPSFSGGSGGKVGSSGSSGSGGGGGAASVVAINRIIVAVAGGAGGGGGAGNTTGAEGTNGVDANTPNSNLFSGGAGKNSGAGLTCSAGDGGGGGGGGGGYLGGTGGNSELVGSECSGRGGYRGNAYIYNALSSTTNSFDTSATPASPLNGTITYSYDVKSPTVCAPTSTTVDIYTVLKFDASIDCTWTVPSTVSVVDIFAVGGGGGGGEDGGTGGGGGAGLFRTAIPVTPNSNVTVRVGYGGRGGNFNAWSSGSGESSTVTTTSSSYNALGGQGGGNRATGAGAGGAAAANGTFAGGAGGAYPAIGNAGSAGSYGISNYFFGSLNTYAGGGGGGIYFDSLSNVAGAIGRNGGGSGASNSATDGQSDGISGTAGTGGGGGGGGAGGAGRVMGGKGGSGVILIRYATNSADSFPASLISALAGRYTPGDLQLLDSNRKGWVDSSGTNASVSNSNIISTGLSIVNQGTTDGVNSTGSSKSLLAVQGSSSSKITFQNLNTGYTLFHVARYITGGNNRRMFSAKDSNWLSGFYYGVGAAHHTAWLTNDSRNIDYKWQLSADQATTFRSNGVDYSKNDDAIGAQATSATNFGINNWATTGEESDFQVNDVLIFNRALTLGEIRLMEIYLSRVDGLQLSPYFNTTETDTAYNGTSTYSYMFQQQDARNNLNDTFTVEAWLKPDTTCNTNVCTYFAREGSIRLVVRNGKLGFILYGDGGWEWVYDVAPMPSGEWHHVAIAKTLPGNNNNSVRVYIDGKLVYTKAGSPYRASTTAVASPSNSSTLAQVTTWSYIGVISGGGERWYGNIDEFKVWKVARSQSEIASDMNSNDGSDPNLQAYYNMNYVSGIHVNQFKIPNLAYYGNSRSDLYNWDADTISFTDVKSVSTSGPYTTITFPRSYITQFGGWKSPSGISQIQTVVVGGGGGGGGGYEGGGGGAGGFVETLTTLTVGNIYPIVVGTGGRGTSYPLLPTNGDSTTAFGLGALGGGSGTVEFNDAGNNRQYTNTSGGSGGGGSWSTYMTGASGTSGQGNTGGSSSTLDTNACGSGNIVFAGGGGGGAGAVGQDATCLKGGNGGAGKASTVLGASVAAGGGGSLRPFSRTITSAVQGFGGTGGGGNSAYTDGAAVGASGGATNGTYGTGSGGGAGYSSNGYSGIGGSGGAGVVALRYITALVPTYTKPTNAYLNAGMTETFTTNVAVDSATVGLTRTFKWESTTPTSNGAYTTLKFGTGAANAAYSWVPSDTATSGSGYLYRLTVTDSDTAGLFITDSSTAFAVINPALKVTSSAASNSLAKKINVSRNETFTITLGTPTYRATLSPLILGITIDTSTAGSVVLKISDTASVGTWLETLTVTDSVSASIVLPLSITVAAPPNLLNTDEIVKNGLVLNLDAGNSASLLLPDSSSTSGTTWRDLSGRKNDATTGAGVNTGGYLSTGCTAPTYTSDNGGAVVIEANSDQCFFTPFTGREFEKSYTFEAWFKTTAAIPTWSGLVSQGFTGGSPPISVTIGSMGGSTMYVGFYDGVNWQYADCGYTPTIGAWTHIAGTYDGVTMRTYINGSNTVNGATCSRAYTGGFNGNTNSNGIVIGKGHSGGTGVRTFPGSIAAVRLYNLPLNASQILQNYNATKARFDSSNLSMIKPSQKYGTKTLESFTATSGSETKTATFSVGDRAGVDWDTTTVLNQINLSVQESLTVGTYFDTVTVTDNLGQSTYLPIKMTITKADTITVTSGPSLTTVYSVTAPTNGPVARVTGLVGFDTATVTTAYTSAPGSTCATGGSCSIGDIGPGGGYVFYISGSVIDSATGISDGGTYLEVAPKGWSTPGSEYQGQWAAAATSVSGTSRSVGQGAENTRKIIAALPSTTNLAKVTADLTYGGKSDWFFPSSDEVKAMYTNLYAASKGDFSASNYWASTQDDLNSSPSRADTYWFGAGNTYSPTDKLNSYFLRPIRAFTPGATTVTSTPTDVDTYTVTGTNLTFGVGSANNYQAVVYETSTLKITQANQNKLILNLYGAVAGSPFTLVTTGGSGDGAVTETVTAGSTASNCSVSNHVLSNSNSSTQQFYCNVLVTKASSRNYKSESLTASVYFMVFINSQPTGLVGSGSTIALNGATSLETSTVLPPSITSLSVSSLSLSGGVTTFTITGSGFTGTITVKFWRNKVISATSSDGSTINIPVSSISAAGATSGRIAVITATGEAVSADSLTITP